MNFLILSTLILTIVTGIKTKELEPGPQMFTASEVKASAEATETQKTHKRYATKEIIMYLTPSQINALNNGNAYITSQPSPQLDSSGLAHEAEYLYNVKNENQDYKKGDDLLQAKALEQPQKEILLDTLPQKEYVQNTDAINLVTKRPEEQQMFYPEIQEDKPLGHLLAQQEQSSPWVPLNPFALKKPENLYIPNQDQSIPHLENGPANLNPSLLLEHNQETFNPLLENNHANLQSLQLLQPIKQLESYDSLKPLPLRYPIKNLVDLEKNYGNTHTFSLLSPIKNIFEQENNHRYLQPLSLLPIKNFDRGINHGNLNSLALLKPVKSLEEYNTNDNLRILPQLQPIKNLEQQFSYGTLKASPLLHPVKNLDEISSYQILKLPLQYVPNYENNKNIVNNEELWALNNHKNLEKEKALAEIVSIASSLPVVVQKEVNIKKRLPEPLPLLIKKQVYAKQPFSPTLPFFYSSLDIDKLHH